MSLKLSFDTTQAYPHPIVVEISTNDSIDGSHEPTHVSIGPASEFHCRVVVSGQKIALKNIQGPARDGGYVKDHKKTPINARGRLSSYAKSFKCWLRYKGVSWHSRGSGVSTNGEFVLKAHVARLATNYSAGRDEAVQGCVGQRRHSNDLTTVCQPKLAIEQLAHDVGTPEYISGSDAQPRDGSRGPRPHEPGLFVGTVGHAPPEAMQESLRLEKVKQFRGITLIPATNLPPFTATQDTGADFNVMAKELADSLGCKIQDEGKGAPLDLIDGMKAHSLGTVHLSYTLICDSTERVIEFYVVKKMGRHQAILGAESTIDLGHLLRHECQCNRGSLL
ncbi:uncharacterized protein Z519_11877 [Cladophialophora bantiana CBS 173.52]|uniref:Uncharacterized protein n=1 Tax=Cladophialophora bantiana (strain ATCC 10958 / CBS 173.52 / CDC B-1940 / NIH 8579) TaxID=1442370 RepID=A0A0D2H2P6_CLAB1|nr:uncharacterized protein Z519_11877 [Cladophialophora bantiana CBS 173.52]KIW87553.1 hypothetical protein Z519_11877 [Cladophialophora bantiana CBS 173.52]